jgi:purine-binding chemotaxis protein CheW
MREHVELVIFWLDDQRYALRLGAVERFVRAVEVTPLPGAPSIVLGAINVAGSVLPVLSLRRRFGMPERAVDIADQFLIARTSSRTVALMMDEALGVIAVPGEAVTGAGRIVPGLEHVQGVVRLDDGLVLIHDLETCLSLDEERALTEALDAAATSHA